MVSTGSTSSSSAPPGTLRAMIAPVACAVAALLIAVLATPALWQSGIPGSDTTLYSRYGEAVARGSVPYRDFFVEYPPGALAALVPPALVTRDPMTYSDLFVAEMLSVLLVTIFVTAATLASLGVSRRRMIFSLAPLATAPLLLGGVVGQRYDPLPALLTAIALLLAVRSRDIAAGVALGLGTAAKLYPALLLPSIAVLAHRRGGPRRSTKMVAASAAAALAIVVPFCLLAPEGIGDMLRYQLVRPLQAETLGASASLLLHVIVGFDVGFTTDHGSVNLAGARGQVIGLVQTLLAVGVLVWILLRTTRRAQDAHEAVLCAAATVCAIVALGRVLSPQFVFWLLPVVPLVTRRVGVAATALLLLVTGLTRLWYDRFYVHVVRGLDSLGIGVLVLRNAALLVLLGLLLVELARVPRAER
jgi:hypothetical protein